MSVAPIKTPPPESTVPATAPAIQGRMDAIEARRVFGWVWDRAHPQDRLLVRVLHGGRMVASGAADRPRVDLRRNGIGDGAYAFEVELPAEFEGREHDLAVVAVSPTSGAETVLRAPSQDERAAEAAISAPLGRVLEQLEVLIIAQRRSQVIQREASEAIGVTAAKVEEIVSSENGIEAALNAVHSGQEDLTRRVADMEVFLMRFDRTLAGFDERVTELANSADRPLRRALALLIALCGISAASAVAALVMLMRI